jgi:hypothetical protein
VEGKNTLFGMQRHAIGKKTTNGPIMGFNLRDSLQKLQR